MGDRHDTDALRTALSMIRADWQDDDEGWEQLWSATDDPRALARILTDLCREGLEHLAAVGGISMGEMLHRQAAKLIPHPEATPAGLVDLRSDHIATNG